MSSNKATPTDCGKEFDTSSIRGKTAIVTGGSHEKWFAGVKLADSSIGAQGIGEAYVRAVTNAGGFVIIADIDVEQGEKLVSEFPSQVRFVKCDVTNWEDQISLFRTARSSSPTGLVHAVVANAGVCKEPDEVFSSAQDDGEEPLEPSLKTIEVNYKGALYTTKLALHLFRQQHAAAIEQGSRSPLDTCLVLQCSIAAYLDSSTFCQYATSKWAVRGLMRTLRGVTPSHGTRVNSICPSFLQTALVPRQLLDLLEANNIPLAEKEDAGECLLRILCDTQINGRALCVVARNLVEQASRGYYDMDAEEPLEGPWVKIFQ